MDQLEIVYEQYKNKKPEWKYPICEFIYKRTYMRPEDKNGWSDTIYRCVKNIFEFLSKTHNINQFEEKPSEMYELFWNMKCLCGGRSLFASTQKIINNVGSYPLNNCSAFSINSYLHDPSQFFYNVCNLLMLGCGVGFNPDPNEFIDIFKPREGCENLHEIEDSRFGWCQSIKILLDSYFKQNQEYVIYNYDKIRPKGTPLKTFGGIASGYDVLKNCHDRIRNLMKRQNILDARLITDICCCIAKMVIAGNVRRSSLLALIDFLKDEDDDMTNLKNFADSKNDYRRDISWCSNNSIKISNADINLFENDVKDILKLTSAYGEPNFVIEDNIRNFGRIGEENTVDDIDDILVNPCSESNLQNGELCNLSEVYLDKMTSLEDFKICLRYAFFYCKLVSMIPTNNNESDCIISKHRRVGVSVSGIHEFVSKYDMDTLKFFLDQGYKYLKEYDKIISKKLGINESVKITVIQPSGTKSNMLGVFGSSLNRPIHRYFIRRVRLQADDPLLKQYEDMGYEVEMDCCNPDNTKIISFPIKVPDYISLHTNDYEGFIYDLDMAVLLQKYWADQSVSMSIQIPKGMSVDELYEIIKKYAKELKTLCFIPSQIDKVYKQSPIEGIPEQKYNEMKIKIKNKEIVNTGILQPYYGCSGDHCKR